MKVHLLDKGYAYIPKMRDITKYPSEDISGNQGFRARDFIDDPKKKISG